MTASQIREILKGSFESQSDREYWENKLKAIEIKEATAKANEEYYKINRVYDR